MAKNLFQSILENIPAEVRRFTRYAGDLATSVGELLAAKGITQRELAARLDMKESQLSRILSGTGNPTLKTMARLSVALDEDLLQFPVFEKWEKENPVYQAKVVLQAKAVSYPSVTLRVGEAPSQYYGSTMHIARIEPVSTHVYQHAA